MALTRREEIEALEDDKQLAAFDAQTARVLANVAKYMKDNGTREYLTVAVELAGGGLS